MRHLFQRYPEASFAVLYTSTMITIHHWIAPYIVDHFGWTGTLIVVGTLLAIARLMDEGA